MVSLHGHKVPATIDEGSELNCVGLHVTKKFNLEIVKTEKKARAADSSRLRLVGQLKKPLLLVAEPHGTPIRLKHVVVVDQVNADILIGEPGKRDNNIITYAATKEISIPFHQDRSRHVYEYANKRGPVPRVARVPASVVTYPGDNYLWPVPDMYSHLTHIQVQPRLKTQQWFLPNTSVQQGHVSLKNSSDSPVFLKKGTAFADVMIVANTDNPLSTWEQLQSRIPNFIDARLEDMVVEAPGMGHMVDLQEILPITDSGGIVEEPIVSAVFDTYPDSMS